MEIAVQEHSSQYVQTFAGISQLTVCASEPEVHVIFMRSYSYRCKYTFVQLGFRYVIYHFNLVLHNIYRS